jgi:hypothetical protein
MPSIDYGRSRATLEDEFAVVESQALAGSSPRISQSLETAFEAVFTSRTQAYREVLVGCTQARLFDQSIDIHKPYINQGPAAYNGRTLDEKVVNPFLQERRIPCSRGPFLAAFRRSVEFRTETRDGLRDKEGFDALLALIDYLAGEEDHAQLLVFLRYVLFCFWKLREAADVPLSRLQRVSLEQCGRLIDGLLATPSGGRFPVMLVEATFLTIKEVFALDWDVDVQGINVADRATGAGGDIVVRDQEQIVFAAEITERAVDKERVVATFQTKIAPHGIRDYLFFLKTVSVNAEALQQARQYFSQGHEVNFLQITQWIQAVLATLGSKGRSVFIETVLDKLAQADTPPSLKLAWNQQIAKLVSS